MKLGFLGSRDKGGAGFLGRLRGRNVRSPWVKLPWSLAVASGKGGTGKTVMTANLSTMLCMDGNKSAIFDADLGVANTHLLLGVEPTRNVAQVIAGRTTLREASMASPFGPRIVPGGSGISDLASLSAQELLRLAGDFRPLEEGMDYLLLDCAAGISVQTILFLQAADDVLVVTNPDFTAMTDAYALIKVLYQRDPHKRVSVVVNRVREQRQAEEVARRLQGVCHRFLDKELLFLGGIEEDPVVPRSISRRRPFVVDAPRSRAACNLRQVRDRLLGQGEPGDRKPGGRRQEGYGDRLERALGT